MVYSKQLHAGGTCIELTDSLKALFVHTAQSLQGSARRLFMARTVKELGLGGQRQAERELGWNRGTLRKGLHAWQSGCRCLDRIGFFIFPVLEVPVIKDERSG
jgi:hypothetical protein